MTRSSALLVLVAVVGAVNNAAAEPCNGLADRQRGAYIAAGEAAKRAYDLGNYTQAIEQILRAMDLCNEDPRTQYNLAIAHSRAGNCAQAMRWYEALLEIKPRGPHAALIEHQQLKARRQMSELRVSCLKLAEIQVNCADPEVSVALGDTILPRCPFAGHVKADTYEVRAARPGYEPYSTTLTLVAGTVHELSIPRLVRRERSLGPKDNETPGLDARAPASGDISWLRLHVGLGASFGVASGPLYEADGRTRIEADHAQMSLAGYQPTTIRPAAVMGGRLRINEHLGLSLESRWDLEHLAVAGLAMIDLCSNLGRGLELQVALGGGYGRIPVFVRLPDDTHKRALLGPSLLASGVSISRALTERLDLEVAVSLLAGFPARGLQLMTALTTRASF
ncbi:MAG: hypothetical protein HY698_17900 [Deltaproteobacteria bacterium]|nr:hypothetical protein [Deltaproteobacteria bacterium]